jgi:tRNA(Ile)-lysidine synthase
MGASGMDIIRDGVYLRPLLKTAKSEIMAYVNENEIPFVEDETNHSNEYARNYIRNLIMPLVRNKWKNADQAICNFGEVCKKDDEYIQSTINCDGIVNEEGAVKIPVAYFVYAEPVVKRMLLNAVKSIGITSDVENKHMDLITELALNGENGAVVNLPNKVQAIKEYNFLTITNKMFTPTNKQWEFGIGKTDIANFGVIEVNRIKKPDFEHYKHIIDAKKLPKNVVWRYREDGDVFEKFGGGTKNLSDFLTDKKIPRRLRNYLPVLAKDKEIYIVAGIEISNKISVDENTKSILGINAVRFD